MAISEDMFYLEAAGEGTLQKQIQSIEEESLERLALQAKGCRNCELWEPATQTVFGEGPEHARILLLGEQPGDQEDLAGRPFVGPAGQLLDRALARAGLDRTSVYVTNTVKHFKFEPRGKRRIHARPDARQVSACAPWLASELRLVDPELVVCLGATAAQSQLGAAVKVTRDRGRLIDHAGRQWLITVHPSYLLRLPEHVQAQEFERFVGDLSRAAEFAA